MYVKCLYAFSLEPTWDLSYGKFLKCELCHWNGSLVSSSWESSFFFVGLFITSYKLKSITQISLCLAYLWMSLFLCSLCFIPGPGRTGAAILSQAQLLNVLFTEPWWDKSEVFLECLSEDISMPLRLYMLLLSADWSFGIRPPTPKWTFRATQDSHKHKQPTAGLVW